MMELSIDRVTDAMGGPEVFHRRLGSDRELVEVIRGGLPVEAVDALMERYQLTTEELVKPLGVSIATIKRRKQQKALSAPVSDRLYRIAKVAALATDVLGTAEKAGRWMHKPNRALSGDTPLSRLDTEIGFTEVKEVLHRIDHGLFA